MCQNLQTLQYTRVASPFITLNEVTLNSLSKVRGNENTAHPGDYFTEN